MPDLVIEVRGGVVTAVYTDLDVTVSANDLDEGIVEGPVVVIPRNPEQRRNGQPVHAKEARAEGVLGGLQEAAFICERYEAELSEGRDRQAETDAAGECYKRIDQKLRDKPNREPNVPLGL